MAPVTAPRSAPVARTTSTRVMPCRPSSAWLSPSATSSRWAVASGRTTVRPDEPRAGPSPARIPVTETLTGAPAPRIDSSEPSVRPSVAARRSVTRAPPSAVAGSGAPRTTTRSRTRGSRVGSMPRTVTGSVTIGRPGAEPMNVRRSMAGAVSATPGTASSACSVASDSPVSANAATRRSARPDDRRDGPVDRCVEPGVRGERRDEHGNPDRDAEDRQDAPGRTGDEPAPGVRDEAAHGGG